MGRQKLIHIHSSIAGQAPTIDKIDFGEIAVNYSNGSEKLYIKNNRAEGNEIVGFVNEKEFLESEKVTANAIKDLNNNKADVTGSIAHAEKADHAEKAELANSATKSTRATYLGDKNAYFNARQNDGSYSIGYIATFNKSDNEIYKTNYNTLFNPYLKKVDAIGIKTAEGGEIFNAYSGQEINKAGRHAHSEGFGTEAMGNQSHSEGESTHAMGNGSHAEGQRTTALGAGSHAEGVGCLAEGNYTHAEGTVSTALGENSHAEGKRTFALGELSHAEGEGGNKNFESSVISVSGNSMVITRNFVAPIGKDPKLHAGQILRIHNGTNNVYYSITSVSTTPEGNTTVVAKENYEGLTPGAVTKFFVLWGGIAKGKGSHVEGLGNIALNPGEHAIGNYNNSVESASLGEATQFSIGGGTASDKRLNLVEIKMDGSAYFKNIGNFDGNNYSNSQTLQQIISSLCNHDNDDIIDGGTF